MTKLLNKEQFEFIKKEVVGKSSTELTSLINQKFHLNLTVNQIKQYKKSHKLRSNVNTHFTKGQVPFNKKAIGSEFISTDGYTFIKVAEPNIWKHKQIFIYEQKYGKIPKGYSVIFADRDKSNFKLENLILVKNKDKLTAKNQNLIFDNGELTKSGILIARLINEASQKKRCNK